MTKYIRSIQRLTAELYNIFLSPLLSIQFFFCSFLHSFIKTIDSLIIFQWNEEENNKKVYLFSKFAVIDVYITSSFYLMSSGSKVTVAVWIGIRYRLLTSQNSSLMLATFAVPELIIVPLPWTFYQNCVQENFETNFWKKIDAL